MPKMGSLISGFLGTIVSPIANYFTRRAELNAQNHQLQLKINQAIADRKIDLISQGQSEQAAWEIKSLQNAGWRGSLELIIVTIPLVLCFLPNGASTVDAGFTAIAKTPAWYQFLVMTIYLANYGIRYGGTVINWAKNKLGGNS